MSRNSLFEEDKRKDDIDYPCGAGAPLTASEAAFVKSIFGNEINTDCVRKYFSPIEKPGETPNHIVHAQTFGANSIKFYGDERKSADYGRSDNPDNYGTFIHEMTHIWQNQLHGLRKALYNASCPGTRSYEYTLKKNSRFTHFGEEQQASIIQDYARQFLRFNRSTVGEKTDQYLPGHANIFDDNSLRSLVLLQKVVEDRFPQARKTRLALEAKTAAAQAIPTPRVPKFA